MNRVKKFKIESLKYSVLLDFEIDYKRIQAMCFLYNGELDFRNKENILIEITDLLSEDIENRTERFYETMDNVKNLKTNSLPSEYCEIINSMLIIYRIKGECKYETI